MNADKSFVLNRRLSAFIGGHQFGRLFQQALKPVPPYSFRSATIGHLSFYAADEPKASRKWITDGGVLKTTLTTSKRTFSQGISAWRAYSRAARSRLNCFFSPIARSGAPYASCWRGFTSTNTSGSFFHPIKLTSSPPASI